MRESADEQVRTAEVIASLCLATDLGMGFPFELGLRATLTTMRLCDVLGVDAETASHTYYACLLLHVGCTVDAQSSAEIFHGSMAESGHHHMYSAPLEAATSALRAIPDPNANWPSRALQLAVGLPKATRFRRSHFISYCEVAEMLVEGVGLPRAIAGHFAFVTERWDGWSHLRRAKGDDIPLPIRISQVGRDATYQRLVGDDRHVAETIASRAGRAFDPEVAKAFADSAPDILGPVEMPESAWDEVLAVEPTPCLTLDGEVIDPALRTMGAFADLASPHLSGHAAAVGDLAAAAAELAGFDESEARTIKRAGYLHDLGRAAVHPRIWGKEGQLTAGEWEEVRLRPPFRTSDSSRRRGGTPQPRRWHLPGHCR